MFALTFASFSQLISAMIFGVFSLVFFFSEKPKIALICLIIASFLLSFFAANADPFLHFWDEQYHALVSKNLAKHMFVPTLYDTPIFQYDHKDWSSNHIWIHKQPLFMWQMALSQMIFGNTELGIRFPDVLMHTLLTFIVFDLGRMVKSERVGYLAALFFTFLNYPLELAAGRFNTDHNDFAFMFYVTASFWAYFRYKKSGRILWAVAIGILAGCAVLIKWLPGLLVFLPMVVNHVIEQKSLRNIFLKGRHVFLSIGVAFLVFVPWQIYCAVRFPDEFKHEMSFNRQHIFQPVEGHGGDWTFHFRSLSNLYGEGDLVPYLLLIAFVFFIFDKKILSNNRRALILPITTAYAFFTFVATKMPSYPILVLPLVLVLLSNLLVVLIELIRNRLVTRIIYCLAGACTAFLFLDLNSLLKFHTIDYKPAENPDRQKLIAQTDRIKSLPGKIPEKKTVLFNCEPLSEIKIMFYTDFVAYPWIPTDQQIKEVRKRGYRIAIFNSPTIPERIRSDHNIIYLD